MDFIESDWFAAVDGRGFDFVVSNPPYIPVDDPHLAEGDVRFEPTGALASGQAGLDDLARIVAGAPAFLMPGGWLMMEHGYDPVSYTHLAEGRVPSAGPCRAPVVTIDFMLRRSKLRFLMLRLSFT